MLIVAAVLTLLPYVWMVSSSFKANSDIFSASIQLIPAHPILGNYVAALTREPTLRAILNSMVMAGGETIAVVITSMFTAYPFARLRFRGRDTVFLMVLGAMMIPSQVTMIPTFILMKWLGWIDTYQGLIVPRAVTPLGIFLMRQFLLTLPRELEEAALIDGCGRLRILLQICLPHLGPAAATLAIFTFTTSWNEFFWPLIVVQSEGMQTIQLLIAAMKQAEVSDWGVIMAIITLSVFPTVAMYLMLQRYFVKGVAMSGIKG
jgi:multiple sugar transport system permease protein